MKTFNGVGYDEKVDVYAYGLILWYFRFPLYPLINYRELLVGQEPFKDYSEQQIIMGVSQGTLRPTIPPNTDPEYAKLMRDCWSQDPKNRPTADEILNRLREVMEKLNLLQSKSDYLPVQSEPTTPQLSRTASSEEKSQEVTKNAEEEKIFWAVEYNEVENILTNFLTVSSYLINLLMSLELADLR